MVIEMLIQKECEKTFKLTAIFNSLHFIMGTVDGMDGITKFAHYISWMRISIFLF